MAWWNTLAKIGGFAAAPFTGGASIWPALALTGASTAAGYGLSKLGGGKDDEEDNDPQSPENILRLSAQRKSSEGSALGDQGAAALGPALQYLKSLTGPDPSAILAATAPERGRVMDQYDTARKAISQFGPRGGGQAAAFSGSQFQEANQLSDITSGARTNAFNTSAQLGTQLTGLGLSAEQLASADLNTLLNAILNRESQDIAKRGQNMEALSGLGEAAGMIIASKMGGGGFGGIFGKKPPILNV